MDEMTKLNDEIEFLEKKSDEDNLIKSQLEKEIIRIKADKDQFREDLIALKTELVHLQEMVPGSSSSTSVPSSPRYYDMKPSINNSQQLNPQLNRAREESKRFKEEMKKMEDEVNQVHKENVDLSKKLEEEKINFTEAEQELEKIRRELAQMKSERAAAKEVQTPPPVVASPTQNRELEKLKSKLSLLP